MCNTSLFPAVQFLIVAVADKKKKNKKKNKKKKIKNNGGKLRINTEAERGSP